MPQAIILIAYILIVGNLSNGRTPTQTIRGVVIDAGTRVTLPGANIILAGSNIGTVADCDGNFLLRDIPSGRYNILVSFMGYETTIIPELVVGSGRETVLEIAMEAVFSDMEEVVVKAVVRKDRPGNSMAGVSARTFSVDETRRYAGSLDDPGRMAGNFAGVTTAGAHVNAIVVRGNAPKGLLWRLEGVDIPVPSHFSGANVAGGGGLTIFSSQLLANSDFYTGAFPAEHGNAIAGVFDMKLRNGNNRRHEYSFQIGVQGLEASAEGPFARTSDGSFLFNYRYSTMALIFPLLPETRYANELPVYQDLSFKLNMPAGKTGTFSLWGIGGLSQSAMNGFDEVADWEYPANRRHMDFHYNMGAVGITHSKSLSVNSFIRSTLALNAGQHDFSESIRLDRNNPVELTPLHQTDNVEGKAILSSVITHRFSPRLTVRGGVNAGNNFYRMKGDSRDRLTGEYGRFLQGSGNTRESNIILPAGK